MFIPAKWSDNKDLMESSPGYRNMLDNLPESVRAAHRDGNWDALAGQYFSEFREDTHTIKPFPIPQEWKRYRAFDYGLDCFACLWIAVDFVGRSYVYREAAESRLIVSDAAALALNSTPDYERIEYTIAPPDMWSTMKDTGKTMAEIFTECGMGLVKGNNSRVQGWLNVKEMMKPMGDGKPGLLIFNDCRGLIDDLQALQYDDKNPSDAAKEPHEITHRCISGDTLIETVDGPKPIKELVGKVGECYCWDGEKIVVSEFGGACVTQESAEVFEIEFENGAKLKATANHKVLTAAGWKMVSELSEDDDVLHFDVPDSCD